MTRVLRLKTRVVLAVVVILVALTILAVVLANAGGSGGISRLWGG